MTSEAAVRAPLRRLPAVEPCWEIEADVVVVGLGAAGLSAARVAADGGRDVVVLAKGDATSSATHAAQGGLAAVLSAEDDAAMHAADTLTAGAGLCAPGAVDALVDDAPREVAVLRGLGARFDMVDGRTPGDAWSPLALGREGGHSQRRIVHSGGDSSGAEVADALIRALPSRVQVLRPAVLIDVLLDAAGRAVGVSAARILDDGRLAPGRIDARAVVLATGGFGHAWATTSNPPGLTGDGLAAALRAGAMLRDVEFVQFHPTVLFSPHASGQRPLASEALRGEGAVIVDHAGQRVLLGEHPLADLAPRDVVAAAMFRRMRNAPDGLDTHLFLDATGLGRDLLGRFARFVEACRAAGIDPLREPVPVAPGAHYACGGIAADGAGRTTVPGLYAVGEAASTGVHGANRLASNSLTEALAGGRRCGRLLGHALAAGGPAADQPTGHGVESAARSSLASALSRHAGVARTAAGLERVLHHLAAAPSMRRSPARSGGPTLEDVEALSLHTVSTAVAAAALVREESRGCHRRDDHPATSDHWRRRLTVRADGDCVAVRVGDLLP
jgi:L-aspartate oxidase